MEARETVLRLTGITKRFGPLVANDAISFELARGEVIALLGENGAGKTTLMNILFGHYVADEGTRSRPSAHRCRRAIRGRAGRRHRHGPPAFHPRRQHDRARQHRARHRSRSGGRASTAAARGGRIRALSRDFGLAVDPRAVVGTLSVGERQRVEILKALYREARILILDEPTAVLTPAETDALFRTLKLLVAKGLSIIFISHKLHESDGGQRPRRWCCAAGGWPASASRRRPAAPNSLR